MQTADGNGLVLTEQLGAVRLLTINRPDKLNAFTPALMRELDDLLDDAARDSATRVLVITGAGPKAFVAGNDIGGLIELDGVEAYRDMQRGQRVLLRLYEFSKPTIAMVNGYALGGGLELALACDFIVASDTARFGFPEITLNTIPGWGGTQLAVKKMGLARAKQMVLTGRHYTTAECREFGFIHVFAAAPELKSAALAFAEQLAVHDPFAMEMAKRTVNRAGEIPLNAGLDLEAANYAVTFGTTAARERLSAFAARRKPKNVLAGTSTSENSK
ncbi:enoyl-CoA hydratase/isomerase family protein [Bradyrhizobium sp. BWA-3-5]|uniref:enoyl-CoA hydratase/isomerase family protein n=1 Tax=Bradyrhizobium sp. BWA-3-5 TaxID=3080013 RepID=UPI00293E0B6E|nr:enoyl-CoA hydratase/isomerase family protein [Bradyrhizobium sp. BWA-3-5]WOH64028.1 enoyl-CoA hydratase/isomerase family protein [Bradyrhizobium sp. BWA-3-5]